MPTQHRVNIVLPAAEAYLADVIAEKIGAGPRGRSQAIRYAIRHTAESLGIYLELPKPKKKSK